MDTDTYSAMFCRQCQETAGNTGCTRTGVCGKNRETAGLMDALVARLEDLAIERKPSKDLGRFVARALFMTLTNANFDDVRIGSALLEAEHRLGRDGTRTLPYAFTEVNPDLRSLKELVLFGLKGIAAYAHHAAMFGREDGSVYAFILRALREMGERRTVAELTRLVIDCGSTAVKAMALLDAANTTACGDPEVTTVSRAVGTRPGILVTGHDLRDLGELLEQTRGQGIDVYTHGEMLPAHAYPELRKYPHLKGHYGGAWHRQQKEFAAFNGAILVTTNCLTPVAAAYRDRIFTTGVAGYPGVPHIADRQQGGKKDFSAVIARARSCPPPEPLDPAGPLVCGFARNQLLGLVDRIVAAVKSGRIKRFVVMAGCDGRHATREYYTKFAAALPQDTVILTAGCAKYRYLDVVKGEIDGIPRVIDAGQCNDAYALARLALALKDAFGLKDVNDLPLEFNLAWYEQKAVAVILALFALGFRNIRLGPTVPAFLSPGVAKALVERFGIRGIDD